MSEQYRSILEGFVRYLTAGQESLAGPGVDGKAFAVRPVPVLGVE
jgi:hypothetical protein